MRPLASMLLGLLSAGCIYDGEGTEGLPCNTNADCDVLSCVEGVCGGAESASTGSSDTDVGSESGSDEGSGGGEPTPQSPPEPCTRGTQTCVGDNALSTCSDDQKLSTYACEAFCGPDDPAETCAQSPLDGVDYCWCQSTGRPSSTCGDACSFDSDCSPGESCFPLTSGSRCAPSSCQSCFDDGLSCGWYEATCKFTGCG